MTTHLLSSLRLPSYLVDISHTPMDQMITKGRYDWACGLITLEHFPILSPYGQRELFLARFKAIVSTDYAASALAEIGLRGGFLEELLALGIKFPGLPQKGPIVAVGSVWHDAGQAYFPYIDKTRQPLCRFLNIWSGQWSIRCRFLAARVL